MTATRHSSLERVAWVAAALWVGFLVVIAAAAVLLVLYALVSGLARM